MNDDGFNDTVERLERELRELKTARTLPSIIRSCEWRGRGWTLQSGTFEITYAPGSESIISELIYAGGGLSITPETPRGNKQRFRCIGLRFINLTIISTREVLAVTPV